MQKEHFHSSFDYAQALNRAALLWGIEPEYGDTWGKTHTTPDETKKGILQALGVAVESKETLDRAVEERLRREWDCLTPPVAVIGSSSFGRGFPIHLPQDFADASLTIDLKWEDGTTAHRTFSAGQLKDDMSMSIGGRNWTRKLVPLPADAPLGYHRAEVTASGRSQKKLSSEIALILCPDRCYEPPAVRDGNRAAGVAVALYGLRSNRNWGCGDFTDLEPLSDWLAGDAGGSFIGLNPLHAIPNRQPFNISPYLPASTFYKNPIYLDLERIGPFKRCPVAQEWYASEGVRTEIESLRAAEFVQYERVWALKLKGLKHAFARFLSENDRAEREAFETWRTGEGELLERYAVWAALDEWLHQQDPDVWVWTQWPEEYREPDSAAVREFARVHARRVLFYEWLQWETDRQLEAAQQYALRAGLSIGLYHDLALATDQYGSDLWAWRPFYVSGCRVGAPPDTFSPKGQDWAFPPPDKEHHRETAYRMFAETIRNNARHGGALRMDHVMRFFRLYWIPMGLEPDEGAYVRDYYEDLLHILALESVRNRVIMIGEDLGTVTDEIRRALHRFGVAGYKVPYFEKWPSGRLKVPEEYAAQALVSSSTHDLPTLAGFWIGKDIEARRAAGLVDEGAVRNMWEERAREKQLFLDALFKKDLLPGWFPRRADQVPELTGELHNAFVGWLAQAPSRLMALNQEDLLKDAEQQNLPATNADQYPNWMHKMRLSVEDLRANQYARDVTAMFRNWLERTGRVNRPALAEHA